MWPFAVIEVEDNDKQNFLALVTNLFNLIVTPKIIFIAFRDKQFYVLRFSILIPARANFLIKQRRLLNDLV